MTSSGTHPLPAGTMAVAVLACCLALFSLDKDSHSLADVLHPLPLIMYSVPVFLMCVLFWMMTGRYHARKRLILSLTGGIITGLTGMLILMSWWMGRL